MGLSDLPELPFFWPLVIAVGLAGIHLAIVTFVNWGRDTRVRRWIVCAVITFAWISLGIAVNEARKTDSEARKPAVTGIADVPYSTCAVFGFPDAESFADAKTKDPSTADELRRLPQDPPGCVDKLRRWMRIDPPALINVYGRADRRPLSVKARKNVVSNEKLAHDRATTVASWIAGVEPPSGDAKGSKSSGDSDPMIALLVARTHVDVAGVRYSNTQNAQALEQDRSVDVEAFWPRQLPINSAVPATPSVETRLASVGLRLNSEGMDAGVALAVLSLFVALSAYLATVGFFMRERASGLKRQITEVNVAIVNATQQKPQGDDKEHEKRPAALKELDDDKAKLEETKTETDRRLSLLPIADLPMIVAALLLALHLFFFLSTAWLRASIVFATFAAMILVVQHAIVWVKTLMRQFEKRKQHSAVGGS